MCDQAGQCTPIGCSSDGDCQAPLPRCEPASGTCVACLVAEDCQGGQICSGFVCADPPRCQSDGECEIGQICVQGACLVGCRSNRDCPDGQTCDTGLGPNGTLHRVRRGRGLPGRPDLPGPPVRALLHGRGPLHAAALQPDQPPVRGLHRRRAMRGRQHLPGGRLRGRLPRRRGLRHGPLPGGREPLRRLPEPGSLPAGHAVRGPRLRDGMPGLPGLPGWAAVHDTDLGAQGTCVECLGSEVARRRALRGRPVPVLLRRGRRAAARPTRPATRFRACACSAPAATTARPAPSAWSRSARPGCAADRDRPGHGVRARPRPERLPRRVPGGRGLRGRLRLRRRTAASSPAARWRAPAGHQLQPR
ncbi:MAG: hypothetical protein MZW92_06195 [Comamonadaceae bacterium]|nr:hypothetical protein [Comamonadaceae bacterium]